MSESDDDGLYDLAPEPFNPPPPPPMIPPPLPQAGHGMAPTAARQTTEPKRYGWSDRMYYILRRLAGLPLMAAGIWWIWRVRLVAGFLGFGIGGVPIGLGFLLLFYGGPSDS